MNKAVESFSEQLSKKYPMFGGVVMQAYETFGDEWAEEFADALGRMFGVTVGEGWAEAIKGYGLFSMDALRYQAFLEKNGRYKFSNYDEVKADRWDNAEFMLNNYMPGMFISYYLWPHHYRLIRHYRDVVLAELAIHESSYTTFCEVGVGTGIYSRETLKRLPKAIGTGYDISEHSLSFCRRGMRAFGAEDRFTLDKRDVLSNPPPATDFLICQEVLEHLDNPAGFCKGLFAMIRPGGAAYITAAINAGHSDHIYLYKSSREARAQLEEAGFTVESEVSEGATNFNKIQPIVSCFFCRRP
jgi:2-polyprenyl-3-methyl-5-hydroxy-6-metoxy-1,4-benzoquinol methylase